MEDVKLSDLAERAIEVVDRAMAGESVRVVNNETRLVVSGGDQRTFPPEDDGLDVEPYQRPVRPDRD
jgi:hypothetical protein